LKPASRAGQQARPICAGATNK
jgi:hypothetical protein